RSLLSAPSISPPGLEKVMARVARKELPETSPAPASGTESPLPDKATAAVQDGGRYSPPDSLRNRPLQQRRMSSDNWTQARRLLRWRSPSSPIRFTRTKLASCGSKVKYFLK